MLVKHDMHILLDLVPGHTSVEHPWFKESMKAGYCTVDYSKIAIHMTADDYDPNNQYDAVLTEEALRQQAEEKIKASAKPAPKPAPAAAPKAPAAANAAPAADNTKKGENA